MELTVGLALLLFGMGLMGEGAVGARQQLEALLRRGRRGFLVGLVATAALQSSSAVTVLLVSLGLPVGTCFPVIMGANVGTTVTAWLMWLNMETPHLAILLPVGLLASVVVYLGKGWKVPVGVCLLFTGMETMTAAAAGLGETAWFQELLLYTANPLSALLMGTVTTAVIQSSGAAIGILQAFCATGQMGAGAAVPILMGQNIGTCATALLASLGGKKNARAVALAHLGFNVVGTAVCFPLWLAVQGNFHAMTPLGVAVFHTGFNLLTCGVFLVSRAVVRRYRPALQPCRWPAP